MPGAGDRAGEKREEAPIERIQVTVPNEFAAKGKSEKAGADEDALCIEVETDLERAFDASRRISVAARPSHTYPGPMGTALRRELKTHGWWIALSLASTIAVTVLFGLWLLPLYAPINIGGVWSVRHDLVSRRPRLQLALSVGAILLLPVGVRAPLFTKAGVTPA